MNILIIEDEEPAARRLSKLLIEIDSSINILDCIVSIRSAVEWLKGQKAPDLILMDIQLADGSSFEIFKQIEINSPVIFITAFDEYAIDAFKVNSVDYLLKPVKKADLTSSINKFKKFYQVHSPKQPDYSKLLDTIKSPKSDYKNRFLIRYGEHIRTILTDDIAYFYTEDKINFLRTKDNHTYHLDYNLDKLDQILDPKRFFRINRQFIISIDAIDQMFSFSKSRVKITLKPIINLETIVSTERSPLFKEWLGGGD